MNVLIVDDTESQLFYLKKILHSRHDIDSITAVSSGVETLEVLKRNKQIDLIISDYQMPEMNGLELIIELKSDPLLKKIPIIIISAIEDRETLVKTLLAGADSFVALSQTQFGLLGRHRFASLLFWDVHFLSKFHDDQYHVAFRDDYCDWYSGRRWHCDW
jgi:CheY-like chemotaxis protein